MKAAELVVALSPYQHGATEYAHVLLPIAPFTETSGTFVNTEGTVQSFNGVVQPLGETRPAWKVLRVLGNLLGLAGFDYDSAEEVRREALGAAPMSRRRLDNRPCAGDASARSPRARAGELERIGEVPIYAADAIVRRARVAAADARRARRRSRAMNRALAERLGLREGDLRCGSGRAAARRVVRGRDRRQAAGRLRPARGGAARDRGAGRDVRRGDRRARAGAAEGGRVMLDTPDRLPAGAGSARRGRRSGRSSRSSRSSCR